MSVLSCPNCQRQLENTPDLAGQQVACPFCSSEFQMPELGHGRMPIAPPLASSTLQRSYATNPPAGPANVVNVEPTNVFVANERKTSPYQEPHRGGAILTYGILSWFTILGFIFGPMAWLQGKRDLNLMKRGKMDRRGYSVTHAGYVMGVINTWISGLLVVLVIVMVSSGALTTDSFLDWYAGQDLEREMEREMRRLDAETEQMMIEQEAIQRDIQREAIRIQEEMRRQLRDLNYDQ